MGRDLSVPLEVDLADVPSPYPFGMKVKRVLWWIVRATLFRCSFHTSNGFRRMLLRAFGARIGRGVNIRPSARVTFPWNLEMENYSCLGEEVWVYNVAKVRIGKYSVISQRSHLCTGTHDYTRRRMPLEARPISIGAGVWVCAEVFIAPGVRIGDMAVIGARSAVFKDMPAGMVCFGHPCRPVKRRIVRDD